MILVGITACLVRLTRLKAFLGIKSTMALEFRQPAALVSEIAVQTLEREYP